MDSLLLARVSDDILIPAVIAGVIVIWVALATLRNIVRTLARERSRREIAAYIAEGSMTPEQGERLMAAGEPRDS